MYRCIKPLLFRRGPEQVHDKMLGIGKHFSESMLREAVGFLYEFDDRRLETEFCGISLDNPVGLAAGFDKNGELLDIFPYLGFGFAEVGSVTARPSNGNPKPRVFRLKEDQAIINRMGLNNYGADEVSERLSGKRFRIPVGINIAKTHDPEITGTNAVEDFCYSFERLHGIGDYITLNISCPNTREGKTFEDPEALHELLSSIKDMELPHKKPLLVKMSPDLSYQEIDRVLEISEQCGVDGYVIGNTSSKRNGVKMPYEAVGSIGKGGISGSPIKWVSTEMINYVNNALDESNIIGVGGIFSAEDAYEKIKAGASLIQLNTGLIYEGPGLVKKIKKGLMKLIENDGFSSISEAVGVLKYEK